MELFCPNENDLILTHRALYDPYFGAMGLTSSVLFLEKYGHGPPSTPMVQLVREGIKGLRFSRIIGIGGWAVLNVAKLLSVPDSLAALQAVEYTRDKDLVLIPTTCGTGAEISGTVVLDHRNASTSSKSTIYADSAILIPELLEGLSYDIFTSGSLDALNRAVKVFLASPGIGYDQLLSEGAIKLIMEGYQKIRTGGREYRIGLLKNFLMASNFSQLAFESVFGPGQTAGVKTSLGELLLLLSPEQSNTRRIDAFYQQVAVLLDCSVSDAPQVFVKLLKDVLPEACGQKVWPFESGKVKVERAKSPGDGYAILDTCFPALQY